ncbi:hypothetical protein CWI69_12120 [Pseudidiomarina halophila]|uniref:Uncharacterized protein n=1 Tax=Pseudidiomarina halophila TaxID=1449799 RepID=A0A432XRC0_9GAMM|nr:hypothetical protein CWI69_12120 [Pseudidiomarina halophila]
MLEVKFINEENGVQLGCRTYSGITHTIIPAFSASDHDIYFTNTFAKEPLYKSWLIKSIDITEGGVEIYISGNDIPDSVYTHATKQRKNFKSLIRKHNIVEVDFGHQSSIFSLSSGEEKNTLRTDSLMPGEMHKKRPCIVMGTRADSVTVIPLTTRDYNNPKHISISSDSFHNLHSRYSEKTSFAALDMVQTVSAHRVFPPREASTGRYRHHYFKYKLTKTDGEAIDTALADIYNDDVTKQLKIAQTALTGVRKEKSLILDKYNAVTNELKTIESCNEELREVVDHLAKAFDIEGELQQVLEQLKAI